MNNEKIKGETQDCDDSGSSDCYVAYRDPDNDANGPSHHTGETCIENGCNQSAGTAWSPYWCQSCNAKRMDRISSNLAEIVDSFKAT